MAPALARQSESRRWTQAQRADLLAVASLWFAAGGYFGLLGLFGLTVFENDLEDYHRPVLVFLGESIRAGRLPVWSPEVGAGYPFLADGTAGAFHPLILLAALLPPDWAIMALLAVTTALTASLTYAFARSISVSPAGAWLAGTTFAFSGFSVGHWIHLNVSLAAMALPAALLGIEHARRRNGPAALPWLLLAGSALGTQWLASHPQVGLISAVCVALYGGSRTLGDGERNLAARVSRVLRGGAVVAVVAAGVSAVQVLPMVELVLQSRRASGLSYEAASLFALPPHGLLTCIWPLLYYSPSGLDWGLSVRWEVGLYVGLLPLLLAGLALVRRVPGSSFWGALALCGLWLALGPYAPLNLHYWFAQIPGAGLFRVPGRFLLLTCLGVALLAGFGLDAVRGAGKRVRRRLGLAASMLAGLTAALWTASWALAGGSSQLASLVAAYSAWPHSSSWSQAEALRAAGETLAPGSPRVAGPAVLAVVIALALRVWRARPGWTHWQTVIGVLVVLDLAFFAAQFWQLAPPERAFAGARGEVARRLAQAGDGGRLFSHVGSATFANQMLGSGVPEVNYYSQLLPSRYADFLGATGGGENRLLDLLGVRWLALPPPDPAAPVYREVPLSPGAPIARLSRREDASPSASQSQFALAGAWRTSAVRTIAALQFAAHVEQGRTVAEIELADETGRRVIVPLRAGLEVAETALERQDVAPAARHRPATVVFRDRTVDAEGRPYDNLLFFAEGGFSPGLEAGKVTVSLVEPNVDLYLYGLALVAPDGRAAVLDEYARAGLRQVMAGEDGQLIENRNALPRVFVAGAARPLGDPATALSRMRVELTDPLATVYLEAVDDVSPWPAPGPAGRATIVADAGTRVAVAVEADRPGLLVLADL